MAAHPAPGASPPPSLDGRSGGGEGRTGGHNIAGHGTCDHGLVIDLSLMKGIEVDPQQRLARAEGGVLWKELDKVTQVYGLATPGGLACFSRCATSPNR